MDVHGVVDDGAQPLSGVQLHDAGNHGRMNALIERRTGEAARGVDQVSGTGNARQRLLDALELADRNAELLADARIGAGGARREGRARRRQRRQRNAAACGQRRHQHLPALTEAFLAADDVIERNENVLAPVRAVLKHLHRREMAMADGDAGQMRRDQRHGDAEILFGTDQMIGIVGLEGETEQRRDGAERDVALVPVEAEADDLAALEGALADDAGVNHRRRIRAGFGTGEAKAGNVAAVGETRQPPVLLLLGAEAHQEFTGAERIRHHHGDGGDQRARRNLADHFRVRIRREAEPAVLLRNNHAEEFLRLDEIPGLGRQVAPFPVDCPVVEHGAEFIDRAVEKRLLFRRQRRGCVLEKFRPVRIASEQIGIPPDIAGLERLALGIRHRRQNAARPGEDRLGDGVTAEAHRVVLLFGQPRDLAMARNQDPIKGNVSFTLRFALKIKRNCLREVGDNRRIAQEFPKRDLQKRDDPSSTGKRHKSGLACFRAGTCG